MSALDETAKDLDLEKARRRARLRGIPPPDALSASLHGFDFVAGEQVVDTVTGLTGEVLGWGVEQVTEE